MRCGRMEKRSYDGRISGPPDAGLQSRHKANGRGIGHAPDRGCRASDWG